jgi:CHAT domain-containing protein
MAKRLPKRTTMVQLTTTPSQTVFVAISNGSVIGGVTSTSREEISALRESLVNAMTHNDDGTMRVAASRLFTALLQPVASAVLSAQELVIVPDGSTADIPFSALVDPATDRYLIENHTVIVVPSASTFNVRPDQPVGSPRESCLLAGDPAFDSHRFPNLHRLNGASEEITQLGATYGNRPLIGAALTRQNLLARIGDADLIQIAAHAVFNKRDANLSVIPLTPTATDSGLLYLADVARLKLLHKPVVMLAGCQTAMASRGNGVVRSFAFAFLSAGSRAVVGSVADIDDELARSISVSFHRELRSGVNPALALRRVQLSLMNSPSVPKHSAIASLSFQSYGN